MSHPVLLRRIWMNPRRDQQLCKRTIVWPQQQKFLLHHGQQFPVDPTQVISNHKEFCNVWGLEIPQIYFILLFQNKKDDVKTWALLIMLIFGNIRFLGQKSSSFLLIQKVIGKNINFLKNRMKILPFGIFSSFPSSTRSDTKLRKCLLCTNL